MNEWDEGITARTRRLHGWTYEMIARSQLDCITEAGMFFEKKGPVWDTLRRLEARLNEKEIDYVVIGGLALNAHNYPRQPIDVDVVMTSTGLQRFREEFEGARYVRDERLLRRYCDSQSDVTIGILVAGEIAGDRRRNRTICVPEPAASESHHDIRTIALARLVELKLVTWRFKDWGDVVELIRRNNLRESFAAELDPLVRTAFAECFGQASDSEYAV